MYACCTFVDLENFLSARRNILGHAKYQNGEKRQRDFCPAVFTYEGNCAQHIKDIHRDGRVDPPAIIPQPAVAAADASAEYLNAATVTVVPATTAGPSNAAALSPPPPQVHRMLLPYQLGSQKSYENSDGVWKSQDEYDELSNVLDSDLCKGLKRKHVITTAKAKKPRMALVNAWKVDSS